MKDWPDGGTYWRGSSHIIHVARDEGLVSGYCVPQAAHIRLEAVGEVRGSYVVVAVDAILVRISW